MSMAKRRLAGQVSRFSWDADGTLICVAQATRTPMSEDPWIVWRVAADGSGTPERVLAHAASPAVLSR